MSNPIILGLGYSNPVLKNFFFNTDIILSCVPDYLGRVRWPRKQNNRCVSVEEEYLPLQNESIDISIVLHGLEFSQNPWAMMTELNRVMSFGGKVIIVVPNRVGMWARSPKTPFGYGQPYTKAQLEYLMNNSGFSTLNINYNIFYPPLFFMKNMLMINFFQSLGKILFRENSGVIIGVFEKREYQKIPKKNKTPFAFYADKGLCPVMNFYNSEGKN